MAGSRVSLNIDRRWDVISSAKRDEEDAASTGLARLEDMRTADPCHGRTELRFHG